LLADEYFFQHSSQITHQKEKNSDAFDKKYANNIILKNHYPPANRMESNNLGLSVCTVHYFWNITAAAFVIGIEKLNMSLNKEQNGNGQLVLPSTCFNSSLLGTEAY
jgi:hypothetical protein